MITHIEKVIDPYTFQPKIRFIVECNLELAQDLNACYPLDSVSEFGNLLAEEFAEKFKELAKKEREVYDNI